MDAGLSRSPLMGTVATLPSAYPFDRRKMTNTVFDRALPPTLRPILISPCAPAKRWVAACLAAVLAAGPTLPARAQDNAPPPAVVVAPVTEQNVTRSDRFVGRVRAIQSVDLVARVEGFLEKVNFQEGAMVNQGDTLLEIEKAPYQAALAAAQAQLASANSQVTAAQAQLKNADTVLARQDDLVKRDVVSQATRDDAQASRDVAAAQVQSAQAAVQQAQAQVQTAELNLSYTDVKAPITGRTGLVAITEGNLVNTASGTIATVVQVDPIRIAFSIPETLLTRLADRQPDGNGRQADLFTPHLVLSDGTTYGEDGKISFASNQIDASTGSLVIYADFPNPRGVLIPGGFVDVVVAEAEGKVLPVVPVSAVLQDRQGRYVFVVNADNKAEVRRIDTEQQTANVFPVTNGLTTTDTVIVQGLQKVRPGIEVTPTPAAPPASSSDSAAASSGSTTAAAPAPSGGSAPATGSSAPASSGSAAPAASGTAPASTGSDTTSATPASPAPASSSGTTATDTAPAADPAPAASDAPTTDATANDSATATDSAAGTDAAASSPVPAGDRMSDGTAALPLENPAHAPAASGDASSSNGTATNQ